MNTPNVSYRSPDYVFEMGKDDQKWWRFSVRRRSDGTVAEDVHGDLPPEASRLFAELRALFWRHT